MGKAAYGIDVPVVQRLSGEIRDAMAEGAEIAVVVGGGNIFRGLAGAAKGMDRATADYMGMLATVMNSSGAAQCAGAAGRAGARAVGHPDADHLRVLRAHQGPAPSGLQAGGDLCRRHRQPFLHHGHHRGACGRWR